MSKSHILILFIVFMVYVLLGGAVFMILESPQEATLRKELNELRTDFQDQLDHLKQVNISSSHIKRVVFTLATAKSNNFIDENILSNWNFRNSFFFALTVVTTIGYGHLAPSTSSGRVFCILYATIGIPMTGILLAAIGDHFSRQLRKVRKRRSKIVILKITISFLIPWLVVFLILPAYFFSIIEEWSFVESVYYCFITLSTIGFGDYVPGDTHSSYFKNSNYIWLYKTIVVIWITFGLSYLSVVLNYISRGMRCKRIRKMERQICSSLQYTQQKFSQRLDEIYTILQDFTNGQRNYQREKTQPSVYCNICTCFTRYSETKQWIKLMMLVQSLKEETKRHTFGCSNYNLLATDRQDKKRRHSLPITLTSVIKIKHNTTS